MERIGTLGLWPLSLEIYLNVTVFLFAIDAISEDEWVARLKIMQLHDCMERYRMFQAFDANDSHLKQFETQANGLRVVLEGYIFRAFARKTSKKSIIAFFPSKHIPSCSDFIAQERRTVDAEKKIELKKGTSQVPWISVRMRCVQTHL
jgi:hypothetical protein